MIVPSLNFFRFLFVGFSSVIVVFSVISLVFSLIFLPASTQCGPFSRHSHVIDIFSKELDGLPSMADLSGSTTTTYILVSSLHWIIFLSFCSFLYNGVWLTGTLKSAEVGAGPVGFVTV